VRDGDVAVSCVYLRSSSDCHPTVRCCNLQLPSDEAVQSLKFLAG